MNDIERRIYTLENIIRANEKFLALVPKGADPKTEAQVAKDRAELAALLAKAAA
jgi:hypothetical protein